MYFVCSKDLMFLLFFDDLSDAGGFAESVELFQVLIDSVDRAQHVAESVLSAGYSHIKIQKRKTTGKQITKRASVITCRGVFGCFASILNGQNELDRENAIVKSNK